MHVASGVLSEGDRGAGSVVQLGNGAPTVQVLSASLFILDPWHPWTGRQIHIHERIQKGDAAIFRCNLFEQASDRWLEIPVALWLNFSMAQACHRNRRAIDAASDYHDPYREMSMPRPARDAPVRSVLQLSCADRADSAMARAAERDAATADQSRLILNHVDGDQSAQREGGVRDA
jgi:hypothetical protein